jgi:glutamine cyclotransferase
MQKSFFVILFTIVSVLFGQLLEPGRPELFSLELHSPDSIPVYDYEVINTYPHDTMAFTQGLIFRNGVLYEGTGLYGRSSLRKIELETGNILKIRDLPGSYFGEGITIYHDTIIQLTWRNNIGFVYIEQDTFKLIDSFPYPTEGWGLTHDDTSLIMSDGTDTIRFLDPHTYDEIGTISVTAEGTPVEELNELEYIQNKIYANVWYSDSIAIIDPITGNVEAWLNLKGILNSIEYGRPPNVLNGIAYDSVNVRLFVTGKLWPSLFEIKVDPLNYPPYIVSSNPPSPCYIITDSMLTLSVSANDPDPEDSLNYIWSVDGVVDTSAHDTFYTYVNASTTVDTVTVRVDDGMFSDTTSWIVYVTIIGIECQDVQQPSTFAMLLCSPNPFLKKTDVTYVVTHRIHVLLRLYDVAGRFVDTLVDGVQEAGVYDISFVPKSLPPGVYFVCLKFGRVQYIHKLILIQ